MNDEPEEIGIPEWVVTFGDMMSLLLTFFIMLVSLSEIKEEETYQALVASMQRQFGYQKTIDALAPGEAKPRKSEARVLSTIGRAKKKDTAKGGVPEKAPVGEEHHVRIIRPGQTTAVGSLIFFPMGVDELDPIGVELLKESAEQLRGRPQKIEVRGHTSTEFASRTRGTSEAWMLGMRRANAVIRYLVDVEGINPQRFRMTSAGGTEPADQDAAAPSAIRNSRVEVFLLDETVRDLKGLNEDRNTKQSNQPGKPRES